MTNPPGKPASFRSGKETAAERHRPAKLRRVRRSLRWAEHLLAAAAFVAILLIATPLTNWLFDALGRVDRLGKADYIVCLGGDSARVIESARLLAEGYAPRLIVSNYGHFSDWMRDLAIEWGADPARILVDRASRKTRDHPGSIARNLGVNPESDRIILVTSYTHLGRARACFEKAGYRHILSREPRWERAARNRERDWKWRFRKLPDVLYEYAAWAEYLLRGAV